MDAKIWLVLSAAFIFAMSSPVSAAGPPFAFAEDSQYQLIARTEPTRDGFLATTVSVRAKTPGVVIDSISRVSLQGLVNQTWLWDPFDETFPRPLPISTEFRSDTCEWECGWTEPLDLQRHSTIDTHLVPNPISGIHSALVGEVVETNDESNPLLLSGNEFGTLDGVIDNLHLIHGIGGLAMTPGTFIGFLEGHKPTEVDVAYVVTLADSSGQRPLAPVYLALGIGGIDGTGMPIPTSEFGFGAGMVAVPFAVPEPGSLFSAMIGLAILLTRRARRSCRSH